MLWRKEKQKWNSVTRVYSIRWDSQGKPLWGSKFKQRPELSEWVRTIWWNWKSLSRVWLLATPWTIGHGILYSKILEWVAFPFSRGSSQPRFPTLQADSLPTEPQGKLKNTGVGSLFFLKQIFPIQESNGDLLHCRWILSQLSYQGSPFLGKSIPIWGNRKLQRLCDRNMLFLFRAWQEGQGRVS